VFSTDGALLISIGRDMSTKLYDVKTQRFIDNVTSITPGALKGGLSALARNPGRDEILVGGSDGVPRIYRMQRLTKRVIGDDANLIRKFPAMRGRIFSVDYSPDGKRIVAASSLDGKGQVFTYAAEFDSAVPEEISAIVQKVGYTAEEQAKLEAYLTADVKLLSQTEVPVAIYAVAFAPDGNSVTAAGADGLLRVINPADGTVIRETPTVTVDPEAGRGTSQIAAEAADAEYFSEESLPSGATVTAIDVQPASIEISRKFGAVQLLVSATLNTGDRVDVTRMATITATGDAVRVTRGGRVHASADGSVAIAVDFGGQSLQVPVTVSGVTANTPVNFIRDVNPIISRLGCNAGTCHGAKDGKNGFKLSLRGYDPIFDVRSFTDDLASRRVNLASPDDSLMLLKATGAVPHVGGQVTKPGHPPAASASSRAPPRRDRFCSYCATSAARNNWLGFSIDGSAIAMPHDTERWFSARATIWDTRSATACACSKPPRSRTTQNSSPPMRQIVTASRPATALRNALAVSSNTRSPTPWPSVSLTIFSSSTSHMMSAQSWRSSAFLRKTERSFSSSTRRLPRPVSGSRSASVSSPSRRSVCSTPIAACAATTRNVSSAAEVNGCRAGRVDAHTMPQAMSSMTIGTAISELIPRRSR
jgi:WD40 repeat protein